MRCVADLINKLGGILSSNDCSRYLDDIFRQWKTGAEELLDFHETNNHTFQVQPGAVKVCVLFDTVSALWSVKEMGRRKYPFVDSDLRGVENAFQALALHERRRSFLPTVLRLRNWQQEQEQPPPNLEQCWFLGYHGNIGGDRKKNAIGNIALAWALGKLNIDLQPRLDALTGDEYEQIKNRWQMDEATFEVEDTLQRLWLLLGVEKRKPRLQFWEGANHINIPPTDLDGYAFNSHEKFHFTVRLCRLRRFLPQLDILHVAPQDRIAPWQLQLDLEGNWEICQAILHRQGAEELSQLIIQDLSKLEHLATVELEPPNGVIPILLEELGYILHS